MLRLNAVHLAVCLLPLALAGCGEPADHDDPRIRPPLVRVATVERAEAGSRAFTGVIVARTQSDLGFRVAGKVLERRVETGQREARVQLPETVRPAVGSEALATRYGSESQPVTATLRLLSDAADATTRTFEARYVLNGALANAPLGSTVTLRIGNDQAPGQVLEVPLASVYDPGNGPGVWRIASRPATVSWQPVTVLGLNDETAQVTGPLKPGEPIVALGAHLLHQGEAVRLAERREHNAAGSQP